MKKIPSMKITNLARVIAPEARLEIVGIRPGEKLHEQMISPEDSFFTYEYPGYYKILPAINDWGHSKERIKDGRLVPEGFSYTSNANDDWMSPETLRAWIARNREKIGNI